MRAAWQPPGPRVWRERFGSSHPIRILRREQYANGELSPGAQLRLLRVAPESDPAGRDLEQAARRLGLSAHTFASSDAPLGRGEPPCCTIRAVGLRSWDLRRGAAPLMRAC